MLTMLDDITLQQLITTVVTLGAFGGVIYSIAKPLYRVHKELKSHDDRIIKLEESNRVIMKGLYALLSGDAGKEREAKDEIERFLLNK